MLYCLLSMVVGAALYWVYVNKFEKKDKKKKSKDDDSEDDDDEEEDKFTKIKKTNLIGKTPKVY